MNISRLVGIGALIVGALSGPSVLTAAAAARSPIDWPDIPLVFAGCLIGVLLVVGFQLTRKDPSHSRWVLRLFFPIAVWAAAAGVSALLIGSVREGVTPSALFFLFIGSGLLVGVWLCWVLFRRKFAAAP